MAKAFWILFLIVLLSAGFLFYIVSTQESAGNAGVEGDEEKSNADYLAEAYYVLFAFALILAIGFIIFILVQQLGSEQEYEDSAY